MQKLMVPGLALLLSACGAGGAPSAKGAAAKVTVEAPSPVVNTPASNIFLYRPSASANKIYISSMNVGTGALSEHAPLSTGAGSGPADLVVTPDNHFAYVASSAGGKVTQYSLNSATGTLNFVADYATFPGPGKMAMDPQGRFLFVLHGDYGQLKTYSIDASTGVLTYQGTYANMDPGARALAVDRTGNFLYSATNAFVSSFLIDQTNGTLAYQNVRYVHDAGALEVNPANTKVYWAQWFYSNLGSFSITPVTGVLGSGGNYGSQTGYHYKSIALNTAGTYLYAGNSYGNQVEAFAVNAVTGNLSFLGARPLPAGCEPKGTKVAPNQNFLYVACSDASGKMLVFPINGNGSLGSLASTSIAGGAAADGLTIVQY